MVKDKFVIVTDKDLHNTIQWLKDGRGLKRWVFADLSTMRPDVLTPGDVAAPHWAYTQSSPEDPADVIVEIRTPVESPVTVTFRVKRSFWGTYSASSAGILKCQTVVKNIANRLDVPVDNVRWDYDLNGNGTATASFYLVEPRPLSDFI